MNKIILPHKSKQVPVDFYSPNNDYICTISTAYEFNDLRIQVKDNNISGYYFVFLGEKIFVDSDGGIDIWKDGFFDESTKQLNYLLGL